MKYALLLVCLCTGIAHGQCKFLTNSKDEFTGKIEKILSLQPVYRNVSSALGVVDTVYFLTFVADLGCFSTNDSKVYLKFDDASVIELPHQGKTACGVAQFVTSINYDLDVLMKKKVVKIRLSGTQRNIDFEPKDTAFIQKNLNCIGYVP